MFSSKRIGSNYRNRKGKNIGLVNCVLDKREKAFFSIDDVIGGSGDPT